MNKYDDVRLSVPELIQNQNFKADRFDPQAKSGDQLGVLGYIRSYVNLAIIRFLVRLGIYHKLIYSNLKLDWFYEFSRYWVEELGNRPLQPHDFYFLYGIYRSKFSALEIPASTSDQEHLEIWQDYRSIYLLFFNQYKLALHPLQASPFVQYIPNGGNVCEYGCGLAPIASSLNNYYAHLNLQITCADIPTGMFHFVRWKFQGSKHIKFVSIAPNDDTPLTDMYNVIFCMAVLEHLPRPRTVLCHLYACLKPGGYFIFDYIRSEGKGLDTVSSLDKRIPTLQYIVDHFEIIKGQIPLNGDHVGTVVCRKPG